MAAKVIISGGGTGGHIFPAIAIADALRRISPDVELLFVGATGKMEMERVPQAGYDIVGLDIVGINRQQLWKNFALPFKLFKSMRKAKRILKEFQADVAVGVGGYASGPLLMTASRMKLPYLIQEQNSYAGVTNRKLGKHANRICVAYEAMDRFFPADRIVLTGNPIRKASVDIAGKRSEALSYFGLREGKKTLLLTGGSLGAQTLNDSMKKDISLLLEQGVQVIWQTGRYYFERLNAQLGDLSEKGVKLMPFLERMDYAYAAADLIIARAGAGTISELALLAKPVVLVPSPNVADDHQRRNAEALVSKQAAVMVEDSEARERLIPQALELLHDNQRAAQMSSQLVQFARPEAAEQIAREVLTLIENRK